MGIGSTEGAAAARIWELNSLTGGSIAARDRYWSFAGHVAKLVELEQ